MTDTDREVRDRLIRLEVETATIKDTLDKFIAKQEAAAISNRGLMRTILVGIGMTFIGVVVNFLVAGGFAT